MRFGGRSATPCEAIVRRRSTGSPPAPRSSISVLRAAIYVLQRSGDRVHSRRGDSRRRRRRHVHGRRPRRGWLCLDGEGADCRPAGGIGARGGACRRRPGAEALHARDDRGHECPARAKGREDGVRRDRRVRAPAPPAPAGTRPPLPALRGPSGSARAARAVLRRRRADRARRRAAGARPGVAAADRRRGGRRLLPVLVPGSDARDGVAEELRRRLPGARIVASHEIAPEFREYERASTTAIDAYLGPALAGYLEALAARCVDEGLPEPFVMRSSGGVATIGEAAAHPAFALLSEIGRAHV